MRQTVVAKTILTLAPEKIRAAQKKDRLVVLMDRRQEVIKHISKEARGIEIGPYFSPLASKREGYNCLYLDVFDTPTLKRRAEADKTLPRETVHKVEPVDLVGSALRIDALCREAGHTEPFDYVVSSHNFEHLPNPIKFLQACGRILKKGGVLSMAVPDKRACFDFFRPRTSLSAWIDAYFEDRDRPSHAQVFEQDALISKYVDGNLSLIAFTLDQDREKIRADENLAGAFAAWGKRRDMREGPYVDVHCSAFVPSSFRLLLTDAFFLGLSPFAVEEVTDTGQSEFYAHLRHVGYKTFSQSETAAHYAERQKILQAILDEEAAVSERERVCEIFDYVSRRYRRIGKNGALILARALLLLARTRDVDLFRNYLAISHSVFFDPKFYSQEHKVAGDAALHYLLEGGRKGLDPGPFFSSAKYLRRNFDVAGRDANPLAHYERFGRAEGRKPAPR